jgi:hypothetical protein
MIKRLQILALPLLLLPMLLMAACGNDNNGGNKDTIFTGFSGVVILVLVVWFVARRARKGS